MTNTKELAERVHKILKPRCPYCDADASYVYYGNNGERYCPNCKKKLNGEICE